MNTGDTLTIVTTAANRQTVYVLVVAESGVVQDVARFRFDPSACSVVTRTITGTREETLRAHDCLVIGQIVSRGGVVVSVVLDGKCVCDESMTCGVVVTPRPTKKRARENDTTERATSYERA